MAITTVDSLRRHLQWAIEIEHGTLPPYLCALYSIKEGCNEEAAEVVHSVFMEEMLHLTMAANILNAVGGSPKLDAPSLLPKFPTYLPHSNRAFEVPLTKFSPEAVEVFMQIEKPGEHDGLPEDNEFETIGQFYEAIEVALQHTRRRARRGSSLLRRPGPSGHRRAVLRRQRPDRHRRRPRVRAGGSRRDRRAGRGTAAPGGVGRRPRHVPSGARRGCALLPLPGDLPRSAPRTRRHASVRSRRASLSTSIGTPCTTCGPIRAARTTRRGARSARRWTSSTTPTRACSTSWTRCFNGSPRLLAVATGAMYGLKEQAIELMKLPSGDGETTVGPSFEYVPPELRHHVGKESTADRRPPQRPVPRLRRRAARAQDEDRVGVRTTPSPGTRPR